MNFSNKKIAVLGLGIEGEDVCRFLLRQKAKEIIVFDQKTEKELGEAYQELKVKGIGFSLGKNYLKKGLKGFDFVFRSPGVKLSLPQLVTAKKARVKITSVTKLFFDLCPGKIVGVTGTKGKGTTATLIYQILKKAEKKVFLAGNIGLPMLALLPKLDKDSLVVLELSSFQLQDLDKSPHLAVVLFITSEHMDYHRNFKEYLEAKANIVAHQGEKDLAVLNSDNQASASLSRNTPASLYWFSRENKVKGAYVNEGEVFLLRDLVGSVNRLKLRGAHNWDNVTAGIAAAGLLEIDLEVIKKVVFSFKGLVHRLELVAKANGVEFFNDSFSTNPATAIAAIRSFSQPTVLIAGGSDKGSDYTQLGKEIADSSVKCLVLIGQMATKIGQAVKKASFKGEIVYQPGKMEKIVKVAFKKAKPGEVVLLSPACASFDMFLNYKQRGELFKKYAQAQQSHS